MVFMKILTPRSCLSLLRGYVHAITQLAFIGQAGFGEDDHSKVLTERRPRNDIDAKTMKSGLKRVMENLKKKSNFLIFAMH